VELRRLTYSVFFGQLNYAKSQLLHFVIFELILSFFKQKLYISVSTTFNAWELQNHEPKPQLLN